MKNKITLILSALLFSITMLMAQSPDMINYQGVAHNLNGSAITNQNIKVRLKIHNNTATGAVKYSEVRSVTTDASGLFNIQIGSPGATSITGTWASIAWGTGAKFLQVEMDPAGGSNFINMGTQQLLSVPYAQYANTAGGLKLPFNGVDSSTTVPFTITNNHGNGGAYAIQGFANGGAGLMGSSSATHGVYGISNGATGNGVYGVANAANAVGVYGNSNNGIGLKGYSNGGIGVFGSVLSGTALYGFSYTGLGLEVNGKVKIAGGNTSPGAGKVLTSDASGNATWQVPAAAPKVAFKAAMATASIPSGQTANVNWTSELYDISNNFDLNTKVFTVPVSGVYHFDASFHFNLSSLVYSLSSQGIVIESNHNGTISYLSQNDGVIENTSTNSQSLCSTSVDARLQAGDQVFVKVYQTNGGSITANAAGGTNPSTHYFCGHLIIAD